MSSGPISNSWRASLTWSSAPCLHALLTLLPTQLPVFWWIFASIRASFPLTNLSGRGVIFISGNPVPQALLPTCYCSLDTALTHTSHPSAPLPENHQFCLLLWFSFMLIFPQLWKKIPKSSLPLLDLILYYSFYPVKLHKYAACTHSLHLLSSNCFHMLLQSVSSTMNWNFSHQGLG